MFEIGAEWLILMSTVQIWATVAIGGILTGLATEMAWRRWR